MKVNFSYLKVGAVVLVSPLTNHFRNHQLLSLAFLLACLLAGCIAIDDRGSRQDMIVDQHYTVEIEGRKVPVKDIRTETSQKPDGAICIKVDETRHKEGQRIVDEYQRRMLTDPQR